VFAPETTAFLEGGCSLIVGTVNPDGEPTATRGWGLTVLSRERGECRLLLDAAATRSRDDLLATGVIAVTSADVPTLRSMQMKGLLLSFEATTDHDRERAAQYADAFFSDIVNTDGTERAVLERMLPLDFVACTLQFFELYDQTPGPVAGVAIATAS
jgi:hypothetical protein